MTFPVEFAEGLLSPLIKGEDGIWRLKIGEASRVSYPIGGASLYSGIEEGSWWFNHRNAIIISAIRHFPAAGPIWDIGGGNGFVARALHEEGRQAVLVEAGLESCYRAHIRGLALVINAAFEDLIFRPGGIAAAGLFDVLEHVQNRKGFLQRLHSALDGKIKGRLYVTVPAHAVLWSKEDDWAGHYNRFSQRRLKNELEASGFKLIFESFFFSWLSPSIFLARTLPHRINRLMRMKPRISPQGVTAIHKHYVKSAMRFFTHEVVKIEKGKRIRRGASLLAIGEA
jgi:hypothetical protein